MIPVEGRLQAFFSPDPSVVSGVDFGDSSSVAVADWDGDGDMDLFIAHESGLSIWRNIGTRTNPDLEEVTSGFDGLASYVATIDQPRIAGGDWNGDGKDDLVIGGNTGVLRLVASGGGWSSDGSGLDVDTGSASAFPALGDMDGDSWVDLLVMLADGTVRLYSHDGSATPYAAPATNNYLGVVAASATGITTGNIDQEGRLDVLVSDADGRIWEYLQNEDGSFFFKSKVWGGSSAGFATGLTIAAIDWEFDGDVDLVAGLSSGGLIALRDPRGGRPTGLVTTPGADSILLTWDPNWQSRILGYNVYRGPSSDGPWTLLD